MEIKEVTGVKQEDGVSLIIEGSFPSSGHKLGFEIKREGDVATAVQLRDEPDRPVGSNPLDFVMTLPAIHDFKETINIPGPVSDSLKVQTMESRIVQVPSAETVVTIK
jgi:hypothetical protein